MLAGKDGAGAAAGAATAASAKPASRGDLEALYVEALFAALRENLVAKITTESGAKASGRLVLPEELPANLLEAAADSGRLAVAVRETGDTVLVAWEDLQLTRGEDAGSSTGKRPAESAPDGTPGAKRGPLAVSAPPVASSITPDNAVEGAETAEARLREAEAKIADLEIKVAAADDVARFSEMELKEVKAALQQADEKRKAMEARAKGALQHSLDKIAQLENRAKKDTGDTEKLRADLAAALNRIKTLEGSLAAAEARGATAEKNVRGATELMQRLAKDLAGQEAIILRSKATIDHALKELNIEPLVVEPARAEIAVPAAQRVVEPPRVATPQAALPAPNQTAPHHDEDMGHSLEEVTEEDGAEGEGGDELEAPESLGEAGAADYRASPSAASILSNVQPSPINGQQSQVVKYTVKTPSAAMAPRASPGSASSIPKPIPSYTPTEPFDPLQLPFGAIIAANEWKNKRWFKYRVCWYAQAMLATEAGEQQGLMVVLHAVGWPARDDAWLFLDSKGRKLVAPAGTVIISDADSFPEKVLEKRWFDGTALEKPRYFPKEWRMTDQDVVELRNAGNGPWIRTAWNYSTREKRIARDQTIRPLVVTKDPAKEQARLSLTPKTTEATRKSTGGSERVGFQWD